MTNRLFRLPTRRGLPVTRPPVEMADFNGIMSFINEDDANKEDLLIEGSKIEFTHRKTLAVPTKDGTQEFSFTPWAFDQFASMLKIPTKYLESCPVTGKGGMQDQVEARMQERQTKEHLIRLRRTETEDGVSGLVRAVLPGNHAVFDNRHLVAAVQRSIRQIGGREQFKLELTNAHDPKSIERSLHMRFIREKDFHIIDDPHRIGFHCRTSEIGETDIRIDALVWRLVCANGMMGWGDAEVLKIKHRNFQTHEVAPQFQEGILASVRQEAAVQDMMLRKYHEPVAEPLTELSLMAARMKLSDGVLEDAMTVYKNIGRGKEPNRFLLMQAFTEAAHTMPLADRLKVEEAVGRLAFGKRAHRGRVRADENAVSASFDEGSSEPAN